MLRKGKPPTPMHQAMRRVMKGGVKAGNLWDSYCEKWRTADPVAFMRELDKFDRMVRGRDDGQVEDGEPDEGTALCLGLLDDFLREQKNERKE